MHEPSIATPAAEIPLGSMSAKDTVAAGDDLANEPGPGRHDRGAGSRRRGGRRDPCRWGSGWLTLAVANVGTLLVLGLLVRWAWVEVPRIQDSLEVRFPAPPADSEPNQPPG